MLYVVGRAAALSLCILLAACHSTPDAGIPQAGPPDQSNVFFPSDIDTHGLDLPQLDREHLAELHALRQVDPCGFVDRKTLATNGRPNASYTYTAVHEIPSDGVSRIAALGGDGCAIAFPSTPTALELHVLPGEPRATDPGFTPDPAHPGVSARVSPECSFRVDLSLSKMANAPPSMHDPAVEVRPVNLANGGLAYTDTFQCGLAQMIAQDIVTHVRRLGVPTYSVDSPAAALLTADPCDTVPDLHATGFVWEEPAPEAQWATTWRHPTVCNVHLQQPVDGPHRPSAVVKYGLADWSDDVLQSPSGEVPVRIERNDVTLFEYRSACFVVAKANATIAASGVGAGAQKQNLVAPTPVVTVRLTDLAVGDCVGAADDTAVAALKRVT